MTQYLIFGGIATFLIFFSQLYEIRSIFVVDARTGQKTRPSRSTFWIWVVVQGLMTASYLATGEVYSAGVGVAYTVTILAIAILSIRYGYGTWGRIDTICVLGAVASVALWLVFRDPLVALIASIVTDAFGAVPTIRKVWEDPTSESRTAWSWTVVACIVNFGAVETWSIASAMYLSYLLAVNAVITYGIWCVRPKAIPSNC
jgi:hypothetical protein